MLLNMASDIRLAPKPCLVLGAPLSEPSPQPQRTQPSEARRSGGLGGGGTRSPKLIYNPMTISPLRPTAALQARAKWVFVQPRALIRLMHLLQFFSTPLVRNVQVNSEPLLTKANTENGSKGRRFASTGLAERFGASASQRKSRRPRGATVGERHHRIITEGRPKTGGGSNPLTSGRRLMTKTALVCG